MFSGLSTPHHPVSSPLFTCKYSGLVIGSSSEVIYHLQYTLSDVSSPSPLCPFLCSVIVLGPWSSWVPQASLLACGNYLGPYPSTHPKFRPTQSSPRPVHLPTSLACWPVALTSYFPTPFRKKYLEKSPCLLCLLGPEPPCPCMLPLLLSLSPLQTCTHRPTASPGCHWYGNPQSTVKHFFFYFTIFLSLLPHLK